MDNVRLREAMAAPNLVKICVDERTENNLMGRVYHRYTEQPEKFENLVQLLRCLETFYNQISFPEEAEVLRKFVKQKQDEQRRSRDAKNIDRVKDRKESECLLKEKGECATFFVYVQYRQKATWQGKITWEEKGKTLEFNSVLELIKLVDNALMMEYGDEEG